MKPLVEGPMEGGRSEGRGPRRGRCTRGSFIKGWPFELCALQGGALSGLMQIHEKFPRFERGECLSIYLVEWELPLQRLSP